MQWWVEYAPYIALILTGISGTAWYFYQRSLVATDNRLNRQRQDDHDLSKELKGVEQRLSAALHQLRADVQSEHKDVWRSMSKKASKEELKQHRSETNQAIENMRFDTNKRLDEMKDLINAKIEPIGKQVQALYNHMLGKK